MKKKQLIHSVLFWHIVGAIIILTIVVVLGLWGFKITYNPDLDNNWEAIGATASWVEVIVGAVVGAVVVPFVTLRIQHKWDNDKQEVANSNLVTMEEVKSAQEKIESIIKGLQEQCQGELVLDGGNAFSSTSLTVQEKIRRYIGIAMSPTAQQIADYLNISLEEILPHLKEMKEQRIIWTKYIRDDISKPGCRWKLLEQ